MTISSRVLERVRMDLGDLPQSFDFAFSGDGVRDHFNIEHRPYDEASATVFKDGVEADLVAEGISLDGTQGMVVFDVAPAPGIVWEIQGIKWRYFSDADLQVFIDTAVAQHAHNRADSAGGLFTINDIEPVEEYPVALYATIQALWALATDAAFDIDILAPDGVNIPRSERYRQLMEMIGARQTQYDELAAALNIGVRRMEVFTVRRTAKLTNRLVPVFKPQEYDDRTLWERLYPPISLQGTAPVDVDKGRHDVALFGAEPYEFTVRLPLDVTGYEIDAPITMHMGSVGPSIEDWKVEVLETNTDDPINPYSTLRLSLTSDEVAKMRNWAFWQLITRDADGDPYTWLLGNVRHEVGATRV